MTSRSGGPSKKLVASLSSERMCEHTYTEDDGMTLEVDCSNCSGAQDIENPKCASGIVNVLASGIVPEQLVLKRFIHVRYRPSRIAQLQDAASALAALRRLEAQPVSSSDKRCQTCPASRQALAPEVIRVIRSDPLSFRASRKALSDRLASERLAAGCQQTSRCVAQVVWAGSSDQGAGD